MKSFHFVLAAAATACLFCLSSQASGVYCRYEHFGAHYGQVDGNEIIQLSAAPWAGGEPTGVRVPVSDVRLLHPSEPQKIFGISGSFQEAWKGKGAPWNTIRWFLKPPTSAASPNEVIVLPDSLDEALVEVEVVIVIGKRVKNASPDEARDAIFGYTAGNDMVGSATSYHTNNGESEEQVETLLGPGLKVGDGFSPFGPYIYTDLDTSNLARTLTVQSPNGNKLVHQDNTKTMAYSMQKIVSDLSRVCSLEPGDIIFSGATNALPAHTGDRVTLNIDGLAPLTNTISK
ncbi:MAG: DUF2437 domain-containing protein [bacterium]|nr:DUF2437 domain-containing protein [bacterium]